ncbi:MAG: hypothetical protein PVTTEEND_001432, partial [Candidatus Fervidibacter sp.]
DNMRKAAWTIALSGGQINYADEVVPPRRWQRREDVGVTFSELGMAMKPQGQLYDALKHLAQFIRSLPFWRMRPHPELSSTGVCLAEIGATYAVFVSDGKPVTVTLPSGRFLARWFNPRTGAWQGQTQGVSGETVSLTPPDEGDWVLLLRRANR